MFRFDERATSTSVGRDDDCTVVHQVTIPTGTAGTLLLEASAFGSSIAKGTYLRVTLDDSDCSTTFGAKVIAHNTNRYWEVKRAFNVASSTEVVAYLLGWTDTRAASEFSESQLFATFYAE